MTHEIFHYTLPSGYIRVVLIKDKKRLDKFVHRLVAEAFLPNPNNKPYIDHIDGSRDNNNVNNLRWCTTKENANNPITLKRKAESAKGRARANWESGCFDSRKKPVVQYSLGGDFIKEWESASFAARAIASDGKNPNGIRGGITACCRGEVNNAVGCIWIFKGNEESLPSLVENNRTTKSIRLRVYFPDGTSKEYDSISKARKDFGMNNTTYRRRNYNKRLKISWEILNTHTFNENKPGGFGRR